MGALKKGVKGKEREGRTGRGGQSLGKVGVGGEAMIKADVFVFNFCVIVVVYYF